MKVYEALAAAFVEEGTSAVFGMMGDTNMHWINAITKLGVDVFEARHEGPALAMAEGFEWVADKPGVCTTTSGPAVTQLATQMVRASRAHTPLVSFCGDERVGSEGHHAFDQARFANAIECGFVRTSLAGNAFEDVQRAFYLARTETRPIMLSAPFDVQLGNFDDSDSYLPSSELLVNEKGVGDENLLRRVADLIESSSHPVIVVGRGAIRSEARDIVLRVADRIGALVATTLMAMNWPEEAGDYHVGVSGLFSSRTAMELFQEADCVIAVGASLNQFTSAHGLLYPEAKFVQFDTKSELVMGTGRRADHYVRGDARLSLERLESILEDRSFHQIGYRIPETRDRLHAAYDDPAQFDLEPGTVDPREACQVIDEMIPPKIGLAICSAHAAQMATMICRTSRSFMMVNKTFGSMGSGIASAIGASVASGRAPVALIDGDASTIMHVSEFDTAVRYNIPVLIAVMNDEALGPEFHKSRHSNGLLDPELAHIPSPDLGKVGVALGGRGHFVRSIEELRSAMSEFVANPGPMLVDIRVSPNVESIQGRRVRGDENV